MNVAFPAVFFFLLITPGFVFQRFYQAREVRAADLAPFGTSVLIAAFFAALANLMVVLAATHWFGYQFYLGELVRLLVSGPSTVANNALNPIFQHLDQHPFEPLVYFLATNGFAIALAGLWRLAVRLFHLDHANSPLKLRPPAPWYYLFSGIDVIDHEPDAVVIAAVVPLNDVSFLYTGLLVGYELKDNGELDRLVLANAARRKLEDDRTVGTDAKLDDAHRFYPIEGDCFVIRASEYTTLNVKFLVLEDAN